jgi:hypothetical protein
VWGKEKKIRERLLKVGPLNFLCGTRNFCEIGSECGLGNMQLDTQSEEWVSLRLVLSSLRCLLHIMYRHTSSDIQYVCSGVC